MSVGGTPGPGVTIGVLALQGDVREHLAALSGAGAHAVRVRTPEELDAVDGLVLPGGESTTMETCGFSIRMQRMFPGAG